MKYFLHAEKLPVCYIECGMRFCGFVLFLLNFGTDSRNGQIDLFTWILYCIRILDVNAK